MRGSDSSGTPQYSGSPIPIPTPVSDITPSFALDALSRRPGCVLLFGRTHVASQQDDKA